MDMHRTPDPTSAARDGGTREQEARVRRLHEVLDGYLDDRW